MEESRANSLLQSLAEADRKKSPKNGPQSQTSNCTKKSISRTSFSRKKLRRCFLERCVSGALCLEGIEEKGGKYIGASAVPVGHIDRDGR